MGGDSRHAQGGRDPRHMGSRIPQVQTPMRTLRDMAATACGARRWCRGRCCAACSATRPRQQSWIPQRTPSRPSKISHQPRYHAEPSHTGTQHRENAEAIAPRPGHRRVTPHRTRPRAPRRSRQRAAPVVSLRPPTRHGVAPPGGLISCRAHIASAARAYSVRSAGI